jgi:hypothetical protein
MVRILLFIFIGLVSASCPPQVWAQMQNAPPYQQNQGAQQIGQSDWQTPGGPQADWKAPGAAQGWQAPPSNQGQWQPNQQWQSPGQSQGQWQANSPSSAEQAGPNYYGNANASPATDQYQEPGSYLNQSPAQNPFNDTVFSNNNVKQDTSSGAASTTATQQGQVHKSHEGLKNALVGVGRALEMGATVAAPMAGAYMLGRAISAGAYSPYGYGGMRMMPYGGYMNPYGMAMPYMNTGMSSFLHY